MDTEMLDTLVKIFADVGTNAKESIMYVLGYYTLKFVVGYGVAVFLIYRVTGLLKTAISNGMLVKKFHFELGYFGDISREERRHILKVWNKGMEFETVKDA